MPNSTPLCANNKIVSDFKHDALHLRPNSDPLGAHTEVENLLTQFNPRLLRFGIVGPAPDLGLGTSAPAQVCVVATLGDNSSEGQK
jgi:hypothetical protein